MTHRRAFLHHSALATGTYFILPHAARGAESRRAVHSVGRVVAGPRIPLPDNMRNAFGWQTRAISTEPLLLAWPNWPADANATHLRITVGFDGRGEQLIEAFLPQSGRVLGTFDLRVAVIFQVFEIPLTAHDLAAVKREGVGLRLTKGAGIRIFTEGGRLPDSLAPHLLIPGEAAALTEFFVRLDSLACAQTFGWRLGCVLDGLMDLGATPEHTEMKRAARRLLAQYIHEGKLIVESPGGHISDGRIYGIEGTLPFAAIAQCEPQSPLLDLPVRFWQSCQDAEGVVLDRAETSSEGAYTVGYPMAVIARVRRDETLEKLALTQLRVRQARLFDGRQFWRRIDAGNPVKLNRNWARGIAWQMLGFARTLRTLRHRVDTADLIESFQQLAAWVRPFQRVDGLWNVFVDEPTLTPDTSGSAGIAAALAIGAQQGWLDQENRAAASRCLDGLLPHLTSDGFLGGVAQSNKGGEALQRSGYRVLYQMAMGLMAQLIAALRHVPFHESGSRS